MFAWVQSGGPRGRRVYSGLRGFTRELRNVAEFILVRVDSLISAPIRMGSLGRHRDRRMHSSSRGFTLERHVVVGFIRVRLCLLRRSKGPRVYWGSRVGPLRRS